MLSKHEDPLDALGSARRHEQQSICQRTTTGILFFLRRELRRFASEANTRNRERENYFPVPLTLTFFDRCFGSSLVTVSVCDTGPVASGLNVTVAV